MASELRIVQKKEDEDRFHLKAGDFLLVVQSDWDPGKWDVLCRLGDGYQPCCSQYKSAVKVVTEADYMDAPRPQPEDRL